MWKMSITFLFIYFITIFDIKIHFSVVQLFDLWHDSDTTDNNMVLIEKHRYTRENNRIC